MGAPIMIVTGAMKMNDVRILLEDDTEVSILLEWIYSNHCSVS